jgi:hypothetical protein
MSSLDFEKYLDFKDGVYYKERRGVIQGASIALNRYFSRKKVIDSGPG